MTGADVAVGLWIALASITGLIYHFMPGGPFLVAAWIFRQVEGGRRAGWAECAAIATVGAAASAVGILAVSSIGRELDAVPLTGLAAVAGAAISVAWLRRASSSGVDARQTATSNPEAGAPNS